MIFHKSQSIIASDTHRFRVVNCGRRFGKTILSVYEMVATASGRADGNIAYIAPTYQQARDIAWEQLKKICRPVIVGKPNESRLEINIANRHQKTSKIVLRGWEAVETLRGQAFDLLVLDEISQYRNFWVNWQEVLRPTLTDRVGQCLFISTPKGFNHFYDLYNLREKDNDFASFHFTSYDNPHLPVEELDKAKKELTEDRFAQEYLADFRKTSGLVYKEFDRNVHIFNDYKEVAKGEAKVFGGVDFGFTNPAAIITIRKDKEGKYFITDEWYKRQHTDAQIADYVMALRWNECYPDPESASGCEELKRRNVNTRDVLKNKDSVRNGINVVRELFKANRLLIHSSCVNLISELETYSYPDRKPDHNEEENPIKENDHALDAVRYALSMETIQPAAFIIQQSQPLPGYYQDQDFNVLT